MRVYKYIWIAILLAGMISCEAKGNPAPDVEQGCLSENKTDASELINSVYEKFVFALDTEGNDRPEDYFTATALKKLRDDYEFDCEDGECYAFYALRTQEQDSKPGVEDVSEVCDIHPLGDGWYEVTYVDMGWSGTTKLKIVDEKIDDYQRCATIP